MRLLEQNKAELTKAEGAEGGGETRRERREGGKEVPWDPYKHWHLCGEHQHHSLQGLRARNRMFVCTGSHRGALPPVGDVGSAPLLLMPS